MDKVVNQRLMLTLTPNKNSYLDIFKIFTDMAKSKNNRKSNNFEIFDENKYPLLSHQNEKHYSPEKHSNKNKSNKSDSNKKSKKKDKHSKNKANLK